MATCFFLNGLSFIAVLIALAGIRVSARAYDPAARPSPLEGLRYLGRNLDALRVLALFAVTACFGWAYQTLLPAIAHERFGRGADGVGVLMAAAGVGSFLAGLLTASFSGEQYRRLLVYGGAFAYAAALAGFAAVRSFAGVLPIVAVVGFGLNVHGINVNALLQEAVPDELRGRVMAVFTLLFQSLFPLGGLLAGFIAQQVGTTSTVRLAAAICLATAAGLVLWSREERYAVTRRVELEPAFDAA
jgi:predicted MFS family arabinose efflux permease